MQTYRLRGSASLEAIVREDESLPAPKPNEIVVRVRAASLNRRDIMILHGTYPLPAHPGVVPLSDGAGEVPEADDLVIPGAVYMNSLATISRQFVGSRTDLEMMVQAIESHRLQPIIDRVFPFSEAREAYAYAKAGNLLGKVVTKGA
jgi:NADPH:quinone reductase-like Zn-dependent oxidoreductase